MELRLSDKLLLMKIKLALTTEKLTEYGQNNFAEYIYTNLGQMYQEMELMNRTKDAADSARHLTRVIDYLDEIENILLACKMGIRLPLEESTMSTVRDLKMEINEVLRRELFTPQLVH